MKFHYSVLIATFGAPSLLVPPNALADSADGQAEIQTGLRVNRTQQDSILGTGLESCQCDKPLSFGIPGPDGDPTLPASVSGSCPECSTTFGELTGKVKLTQVTASLTHTESGGVHTFTLTTSGSGGQGGDNYCGPATASDFPLVFLERGEASLSVNMNFDLPPGPAFMSIVTSGTISAHPDAEGVTLDVASPLGDLTDPQQGLSGVVQADEGSLSVGVFLFGSAEICAADSALQGQNHDVDSEFKWDVTVTVTVAAGQTGACCDSGGSCTQTTQAACAGTYQGDGTTCDSNPCGSVHWINPAGGLYADATNWDPQQVPADGDTAVFDLSTPLPIPISVGGATASRWKVDNSSIITSGDAALSETSPAEPSLAIGAGGNLEQVLGTLNSVNTIVSGTLTLSSGARLTADSLALVLPDSGVAPTLVVNGDAETTSVDVRELRIESGSLEVNGNADLAITGPFSLGGRSGGQPENSQDAATLTLGRALSQGPVVSRPVVLGKPGTNAQALGLSSRIRYSGNENKVLGPSGPGKLIILPNGSVDGQAATGDLIVAENQPAEVTLDGSTAETIQQLPRLTWGLGLVTIGQHAPGTLQVIGGGQVECGGNLGVGDSAKGTMTVTGVSKTQPTTQPSKVAVGGILVIGSDASGEVKIDAGGQVECGGLLVGKGKAGAKLTVSGGSKILVKGSAEVGGPDQTELASVELCGTDQPGDEGTLEFAGGFLSGPDPHFLTIGKKGRLIGKGQIKGSVIVQGKLGPGCSPGVILIDGPYEQTEDGVLEIEVAGLEEGQFDVLQVTGDAAFGGTLEVHFLNGFLPRTGDSVDFLQVSGTTSGNFAQITFPELAPGFDADLSFTPDGKVRLTARTDAVAGDGTSLTPPAGLTAATSAPTPNAAACGAGACGAGLTATMAMALMGLGVIKRSRHQPRRAE